MAPKALLALGLLLGALLFVSSSAAAAAGEQVAGKDAGEQQTVEDVKENFYKRAAATETAEGGVGESKQRFCPCCETFRRRCVRLCCPNGEQIPLDVEAEAEPHD